MQRPVRGPRVGVLALQGAFAAHAHAFAELGAQVSEVRRPDDLAGLDAIAMPGGESTTMSRLLLTSGLFDALKPRIADGLAVFGTCAGMILLATEVLDGRPDQVSFGAIDLTVRRNGYGRQVDSFEADLRLAGTPVGAAPYHAVFIRAPLVESVGPNVEVLAEHGGHPVLVRQGATVAAAFHPELTDDGRLHAQFLSHVHPTPSEEH